MPSCTIDDVAGMGLSGLVVAQIRRSTSSSAMPACLMAAVPASIARVDVVSPSPAIRRSRMPVRATIHSSLVSTLASRSALVSVAAGTARPQPPMVSPALTVRPRSLAAPPRGGTSRRAQPRDGLALADALALVGQHAHELAAERALDG